MVRTKATAIRTFGGKANTKGKKGGGDDDIKVKVPKNVTTVAPNEKVVNLAGFLNENYKPNKKPTERKKPKKFEGIRAAHNTCCHQCGINPFRNKKVTMVKCQNIDCPKRFCNKCLEYRYGIKTFGGKQNKEEEKDTKENEKKEEKVEEEEDQFVEPDGPWLCPICEDICTCASCMRKKGLKPFGGTLSKLMDQIDEQFDSVYAYLIFERDQKRKQEALGILNNEDTSNNDNAAPDKSEKSTNEDNSANEENSLPNKSNKPNTKTSKSDTPKKSAKKNAKTTKPDKLAKSQKTKSSKSSTPTKSDKAKTKTSNSDTPLSSDKSVAPTKGAKANIKTSNSDTPLSSDKPVAPTKGAKANIKTSNSYTPLSSDKSNTPSKSDKPHSRKRKIEDDIGEEEQPLRKKKKTSQETTSKSTSGDEDQGANKISKITSFFKKK